MTRDHRALRLLPAALAAITLVILSTFLLGTATSQPTTAELRMPEYDGEGRLLLPEDWRRWVFVGASVGLSYSEGAGGMDMFHETLIEPSAYEHFAGSGEFRDGTMFVLLLHGTGEGVLPQRRGMFATEVAGLEMAVKDSRARDTWSYYGFGGRSGMRDRATAIDADACNSCHTEHGAHDNVFLQFYPLLAEVAPEGTVFASNTGVAFEPTSDSATAEQSVRLALEGLDPVLLVDGHAELGKREIVVAHDGLTYQFVSEPTRAKFEADPERYAFQNDSCPVIAGAPVDPSLFAVHDGRIYGFASQNCVDQFEAEPERYLPAPTEG